MKYALLVVPLLSVGAAQSAPTCETLLADLEHTAAATRSVTRTFTMNAGDRELSHSVVKIVQAEGNLEVTTLEQRGRLPPGQEGEGEQHRHRPPGLDAGVEGLDPRHGAAGGDAGAQHLAHRGEQRQEQDRREGEEAEAGGVGHEGALLSGWTEAPSTLPAGGAAAPGTLAAPGGASVA